MSYLIKHLQNKYLAAYLGCVICFGLTQQAMAAGWYNMPTSLMQCIGYGYGPGYHSPLILGPRMAAGIEAKRTVYVPRAPISYPSGTSFGDPCHVDSACDGMPPMDSSFPGMMPTNRPMTRPAMWGPMDNSMSPAIQPTLAPTMNLTAPMNSARGNMNSTAGTVLQEARKPNATRGAHPWHR